MMNDLIQAQQVPSAIFAASDPIAIGALRAIYIKMAMKVPQDVSIIGFDNIDTANYTSPPLIKRIFAPTFDMGYMGARMLFDAFKRNENISPVRIHYHAF